MPAGQTYGSDISGLVWGYHFQSGKPARTISTNEVNTLIPAVCANENEFLWLHFTLANSSTIKWLQQQFELPQEFYESLQGQAGSTRLEQEVNSLIVIINDVMYDFNVDSAEISTAHLYIDRNLIISLRLRPLRSMEQLRTNVREGQPFRSSITLLAHLLEDQADVLTNIIRDKAKRIDKIEDSLLANRLSFHRGELGSVRRVLVRLQRLLAPEPAAFFRLLNRPPEWIHEHELVELRQSAEEFSLAVGDTSNMIERVKLLQEELAARINEQSNRTLSILTLVTVLALPINLTAGLFGMNVGGIPWSDAPYGFLWVAGSICLFTVTLGVIVWNRNKE